MEFEEIESMNLRDNALPFALSMSEDDSLSILTENEVHILKFAPCLRTIDNKTNFYKLTIKPRDEYPSKNILPHLNYILTSQTRLNIYDTINDLVLNPDGRTIEAAETSARCSACCWSPAGVVSANKCALMFLSNVGNVDIQVDKGPYWAVVLDLTKLYIQTMNYPVSRDDGFENLKKYAYKFATACIEWSPQYGLNEYTYIVMGQVDGHFVIWKCQNFVSDPAKMSPALVTTITASSDRLTALHWIKPRKKSAIIVSGDLTGKMKGHYIQDLEKPAEVSEIEYWPDADDIRIDKIYSENVESNIMVIAIKRSFVLIFLITETGVLVDTKFHRVGNLAITGVQPVGSSTYVICTLTSLIAKITISVKGNKIVNTEVTEIKNSLNSNHVTTSGICCSKQQALWMFCTNYCKPINHLIIREPLQLFICHNTCNDVEEKLLNNPSENLTNYWDCMELCKLLGEKKDLEVASIDNIENVESLPLYRLKVYMWMSIMSHNVLKKRKRMGLIDALIPDDFVTCVKTAYCLQKLEEYAKFKTEEHKLSVFQRKSVSCIREFLTEVVKTDLFKSCFTTSAENNVVEKLLTKTSMMITKEKFICTLCDQSVYNGKCSSGHNQLICGVSFVPITSPWYPTCEICQLPGHPESEDLPIICLLCDNVMKLKSDKYIESPNSDE